MPTPYESACYAARQAGRLFLTHARVVPGFTSPADLPGLGLYACPKSGLEIVLTRSGAVDQAATKARRKAKEEAARYQGPGPHGTGRPCGGGPLD